MKRIFPLLSVIALVAMMFGVNQAKAAALTSLTDTLTTSVAGALADHEIKFVTPTGVEALTDTITVTFPGGFTMGTFNILNVDLAVGSTNNCVTAAFTEKTIAAGAGASPIWGAAQLGQVITFTAPTNAGAGEITADRCVRIRIGSNAITGGAGTTQITNTITSGNANIAIGGTFGDAGNAAVAIIPAAVANLDCVGGDSGNVWLRWTVPTGTTGYDLHYSLATITDANFGDPTATNYAAAAAWPVVAGTIGQTTQQLVLALVPNNLYFFNLKATGTDATTSAVSNTVYCQAPGASYARTASSPTSTITSPVSNAAIQSGQAATISGTSSDTSGAVVSKVEVSVDGGTTWYMATLGAANNSSGFGWTYVWQNPGLGTYTIKSRASDYNGYTETPSAGVSIQVLASAPSVTVEILPATVSLTPALSGLPYAAPVGATQIQADITYLQEQLIVLLQQLLAVLQAQAAVY